MERLFTLSCESTVDMPYSYISGRDIPIIFYYYNVDGTDHTDDMGRDPDGLKRFYSYIDAGKIPTTSQINTFTYLEYFRTLPADKDILHISLGTGMTASVRNAMQAAEMFMEEFPGRTIKVIDSLCSSTGYGMLTDYAADLRDEGKTLDETAAWVEENRQCIHHQFYSIELKYYRRTGRMSGPTAALATLLNVCPLMRLNDLGQIKSYSKTRGKKNAIANTIKVMEEHARGGLDYTGKCFVNNSRMPDDAAELAAAVEQRFPQLKGKIKICDIGTIIGSHCGPGTVALFFLGDKRPEGD